VYIETLLAVFGSHQTHHTQAFGELGAPAPVADVAGTPENDNLLDLPLYDVE